MNYQKHYNVLINRSSKTKPKIGYFERHHILPKCMGGKDKNNIVYLTPEEHYVAHQLLVKIYPNEPKLVYAAKMMTVESLDHSYRGNKLYGWLKKKWNKNRLEDKQWNKNIGRGLKERYRHTNNALKGRKLGPYSEERKKTLRKPKSTTINMRLAALNRSPPSIEHRIKVSNTIKRIRSERFWSTKSRF